MKLTQTVVGNVLHCSGLQHFPPLITHPKMFLSLSGPTMKYYFCISPFYLF